MSTRQRSARTRIRRLTVGRSISITGGAAAYTALNFTVWDRTHSPSMQALSAAPHLRGRGTARLVRGCVGGPLRSQEGDDLVRGDLGCVLPGDGVRPCSRDLDRPRLRIGDRGAAVLVLIASGDPVPGGVR